MAITDRDPDTRTPGSITDFIRAERDYEYRQERDHGVHDGPPLRTLDDDLREHKATAEYAYFEAKVALGNLLDADPKGWEDAMVLLRRLASDRHAHIVGAALDDARKAVDVAARYEDLARAWTGQPAPEDRVIDASL